MHLCRIELPLPIEQECEAGLDIRNFRKRISTGCNPERLVEALLRFRQLTEHVIGTTGVQQPVNLRARGSYFFRFAFCLLKVGKGLFKVSEVIIGESKISRSGFYDCPG